TGTEDDSEDGADGIVDRFKETIVNAKDKVVESFQDWWTGIKEWFSNLGKDDDDKEEIHEAGGNILDGMAEGVEENEEDFIDKVAEFIKGALKVVGAAILIVAIAIGREVIKGIIEGVDNGADLLVKAFEWLWEQVKKVFNWGVGLVVGIFESDFISKITGFVSDLATDFGEKVAKMWNDVKGWFVRKSEEIGETFQESFVMEIIEDVVGFVKDFRE